MRTGKSSPQDPGKRHSKTRARRMSIAGCAATAVTAAVLVAAPGSLGAPGARASAATSPAAAKPLADLACQVFVEQDNFSHPLNKNGRTTSPNEIKGATVGCSSPNGKFAPGNRDHNPVLLSSSYTSVGAPSMNKVTLLNRNCTTFTQSALLKFTWNTGDVSIGRLYIDRNGKWTSKILSGLLKDDSFTLSGPALSSTDSYITYLGSCSVANTGGEIDGFIFNSWLPGATGSTGNEVGLTFAQR